MPHSELRLKSQPQRDSKLEILSVFCLKPCFWCHVSCYRTKLFIHKNKFNFPHHRILVTNLTILRLEKFFYYDYCSNNFERTEDFVETLCAEQEREGVTKWRRGRQPPPPDPFSFLSVSTKHRVL